MKKGNFGEGKLEHLLIPEDLLQEIMASNLFPELAEALQREGRVEEAIIICEQGLTVRPDNLKAHLILGGCYLQKGCLGEAREHLEKVREGIEECFSVYKLLSQVYLRDGDVEGAMASLKKTLTLPPAEDKARKKVTPLELDMWQKKIAPLISVLRKEDRESPMVPLAHETFHTETMAQIYWKQGRKEKALEIYRELLARDPDNKNLREKYSSLVESLEEENKQVQKQKLIEHLENWLRVLSSKER